MIQGETVADDYISIRTLGDELLTCEQKRAIAVEAYEGLRQAIDGKRWYQIQR